MLLNLYTFFKACCNMCISKLMLFKRLSNWGFESNTSILSVYALYRTPNGRGIVSENFLWKIKSLNLKLFETFLKLTSFSQWRSQSCPKQSRQVGIEWLDIFEFQWSLDQIHGAQVHQLNNTQARRSWKAIQHHKLSTVLLDDTIHIQQWTRSTVEQIKIK